MDLLLAENQSKTTEIVHSIIVVYYYHLFHPSFLIHHCAVDLDAAKRISTSLKKSTPNNYIHSATYLTPTHKIKKSKSPRFWYP